MRVALTAAELEQRLAAEFPEAFHRDSGLAILDAGHRAARVRLVPPGNALRPGGTISGPTLMLLADVAMYVAVLASIGWVPLGPREPFRPWYHASDNYVRQVNVSHVTNITNINNVTINNYVNRGGATSIPAAAMAGSRPVQAVAHPITPQQFAAARPILGQQPLRPTAATAGVSTTAVASLDRNTVTTVPTP